MAAATDAIFILQSVIRGHHVYKSIWTPVVGEHLDTAQEDGNGHDLYAVAVTRSSTTVGHIPREYSRTFYFFISHGGRISCEVTGSRQHGLGLEVPCVYKFTGDEKLILKLKKTILKKRKKKRQTL